MAKEKATLLIMVGVPGAGKTTASRKLAEKVFCVDEMREYLWPHLDVSDEEYDTYYAPVLHGMINIYAREALKAGYDVVIDGMHLTEAKRAERLQAFEDLDIIRKACYCNVTPAQAIENCTGRKQKYNAPPSAIIYDFSILEAPIEEEGFDEIIWV